MAKLTDAEYARIFNIYQDIKKSYAVFQPNQNRDHNLDNMPSGSIFGFLKKLNKYTILNKTVQGNHTHQEYDL
jgi:hypothetical protein